MNKIVSCCGVVCTDCDKYPQTCAGCNAIQGKVHWLKYTGQDICDIYHCCNNEKDYTHCGQCTELPCSRYDMQDPTISEEENAAIHAEQMKMLRRLS